MRGVALLCVLAGVPGAFFASPALARRPAASVPGAPSPAVKAAAKRHFNEAQALFEAGDYEKAMAAFQAAYAAWPLDGFNFNIAQCHRNLGHTAEAIDYFERYLKSPSSARNRAEVEQVLAELRVRQAAASGESRVTVAPQAVSKSTEGAAQQPVASSPPVVATPGPVPVTQHPAANPPTPATPPVASAVTAPLPSQAADDEKPIASAESRPVEQRPAEAAPAEAKPEVPAAAMSSTPAKDETPVYKRGWFWGATAAAFVVVGGAVTVAAFASERLPSGSLGTADWR